MYHSHPTALWCSYLRKVCNLLATSSTDISLVLSLFDSEIQNMHLLNTFQPRAQVHTVCSEVLFALDSTGVFLQLILLAQTFKHINPFCFVAFTEAF